VSSFNSCDYHKVITEIKLRGNDNHFLLLIVRKRRRHTVKLALDIGEDKDISSIYGSLDKTLKVMEETLGIEASIRGTKIFLNGDKKSVTRAEKFIKDLYSINSDGYTINPEDLKHILMAVDDNNARSPRSRRNSSQNGSSASLKDYFQSNIPVSSQTNFIVP